MLPLQIWLKLAKWFQKLSKKVKSLIMRVIKNIVGILARNIHMYNVCHRSLSILHVWLAGK